MKLCAFDIETTGTDRDDDRILELGALVFDAETGDTLGEFERAIHWERLTGDPYALMLNAGLIARIAKGEGTTPLYDSLQDLWGFLSDNFPHRNEEAPIAVGFNVGSFDLAFLRKAAERSWSGGEFFHHRTVELGSLLMAYTGSPGPVSSKEALPLLGEGREVAHTALQDCRDARDLYMLSWQAGADVARKS